MDPAELTIIAFFTMYVAMTVYFAEHWHGLRPRRLRVRPDDAARIKACLNAAHTDSRRRPAWTSRTRKRIA